MDQPSDQGETGPLEVDNRTLRCLMVAQSATSSHILDWAQAAARFADVTVMGFRTRSPENWEWINKEAAVREEQGVRLVLVPQRSFRPSRVMWRLNAAMKARTILRALGHLESTIGVPDVVQGHWYPEAAALLAVSDDISGRYIHTEHDSLLLNEMTGPSRAGEKILRMLSQRADAVIAVGPELANALEQRGAENVVVMPNPVNEASFQLSSRPAANDRVRLVTVGRLIDLKRHGLLLRAISALVDTVSIPLVVEIIGDGPLRSELQNKISDLRLNDHVQLMGWLDRTLVAQRLSQSHVYVHTAEIETFSVSLVEAQLAGLPIVALRAGGLTETIENWQGESVSGADVDDLAASIARVVAAAPFYDRAAISHSAATRYGLDAVAGRLRSVYQTTLSAAG